MEFPNPPLEWFSPVEIGKALFRLIAGNEPQLVEQSIKTLSSGYMGSCSCRFAVNWQVMGDTSILQFGPYCSESHERRFQEALVRWDEHKPKNLMLAF